MWGLAYLKRQIGLPYHKPNIWLARENPDKFPFPFPSIALEQKQKQTTAPQTMDDEKDQVEGLAESVGCVQDDSRVTDSTIESTARERRLVRKVDFRVLPMLSVMFAVSIIDRISIGSAKVLGMSEDLELTGNRYSVCLLLFFPAYFLAALPSNYLLVKFRPDTWLSFIMLSWGAILTSMAFTHDWRVLAFLRFMLGLFEGGLLTGVIYIVSSWYVFPLLIILTGL